MDPDGRAGSLIMYTGNGNFYLNKKNLHQVVRTALYNANNDPNNWKPGEIGINTQIGAIRLAQPQTNYLGHPEKKIPGIDSKDGTIKVVNPTAKNTNRPDKRYKNHSVNTMSPSMGGKAASWATLAVDVLLLANDLYSTWAYSTDMQNLKSQTDLLEIAFTMVNASMDLIPEEYRTQDGLGKITNYVFQGDASGSAEIQAIGDQILKKYNQVEKDGTTTPLFTEY